MNKNTRRKFKETDGQRRSMMRRSTKPKVAGSAEFIMKRLGVRR